MALKRKKRPDPELKGTVNLTRYHDKQAAAGLFGAMLRGVEMEEARLKEEQSKNVSSSTHTTPTPKRN